MYGACTEDWHDPCDVAWCDRRDHAFNAFVRILACGSMRVLCIETLHRPLPHWRRGRYVTVTLLVSGVGPNHAVCQHIP
jgi:hypothetical protein